MTHVASAGVGGQSDVVTSTVERRQRTGIDYSGVFYTNKYVIEQPLKQGNGGVVVNLASMFGPVANSNNIADSASKGGDVDANRAAGAMYAEEGIRVNAVASGVIRTPLIDEPTLEQYAKLHPAGRIGEAQEVADPITFPVSTRSSSLAHHSDRRSLHGGLTLNRQHASASPPSEGAHLVSLDPHGPGVFADQHRPGPGPGAGPLRAEKRWDYVLS